ncbi:MAG: hypothetical protein ABW321_04545 [Polyangiales bacterium]
MRGLLTVVLCLGVCAVARADGLDLKRALTEQRLQTQAGRTTAGYWLLGFGLASAAAGGVAAGVGHDQKVWLAAGITTAGFGVVNAALSLGLLDLSGAERERVLRDAAQGDFAALRENEMVNQLHSGQFFAVNTGLDVFYIAAGVLLCVIAAVQDEPDRWELGVGSAMVGQGVFLLGFDVVSWLAANRRASNARALHATPP